MLKSRRKYIWLLLILLGIGIVSLGRNLGLEWQARKNGTVRGLLTEIPCAPPCWQSFSPGTTVEKSTVIQKLRRIPGIGAVWENEIASAEGVSIMWLWNDNPLLNLFSPSWPGYNNIYLDQDDTLISITLNLDFELTIAELIDKYGIPESIGSVVTGIPQPGSGSISLFYPQHGLICQVEVFPDYRPVLEPNSIVYKVVYQSPGFALDSGFEQPWIGYGELEVLKP